MKQLSSAISSISELTAFLEEKETQALAKSARSVLAQVYTSQRDTELLAQMTRRLSYLSDNVVIAGATSFGEICNGSVSCGATVISLSFFDTAALVQVALPCSRGNEASAAGELVKLLPSSSEPIKGLLLLATPISLDCHVLLAEIYRREPALPVFGGGAGDLEFERTLVFSADRIFEAGLVAVALCGENLEILRCNYLGWAPMGRKMRITEADGSVIKTVDGQPALEMYKRYLGITTDNNFFFNAKEFPMLLYRHGDLIARVPHILEEGKGIRFSADVNEGDEVQFGYAHVGSILEGVKTTQDKIRAFRPEGISIYSCAVRHFVMQKDVDFELRPFGELAPAAGFFTAGEFCSMERHSSLLNATLLVVGMRERPVPHSAAARQTLPVHETVDIFGRNHVRILLRFQHFMRVITEELETANRELLKQKLEAERANASKSRFLAAASHDLRQPLHALGLLVANMKTASTEAQRQHIVEQMERALEQMGSQFHALLDVSKLDAGVIHPQPINFPLSDLLDAVGAEYGSLAAEKGLRLKVHRSRIVTCSDPVLVGQILRNLISNGIKYTTKGHVRVGVRRVDERHCCLMVIDSGLGIPEHEQESVFQEFYQSGNGKQVRAEGMGLGLAIVRRISRLLGHPVSMRSRVGRGTVFSVMLPVSDGMPEQKLSAQVADLSGACFAGKLVAILDDDPFIVDNTAVLLNGWGCKVVAGSDYRELAAKLCEIARRPDLVIFDYTTRDRETGVELARRLQAQYGDSPPPVMILTGDTSPEKLAELRASGFCLQTKPLHPAKLRVVMGRIFEENDGGPHAPANEEAQPQVDAKRRE